MSVAPNSRASCLPRLVSAHRDDALGAHLLRGQHAEQTDRAVTDDDDRRARLDVGGIGREPARAHHVGEREQARDHVGVRNVARRDERAVRERHAHARRLRADDELAVLTRRLIAVRQCGHVLSDAKNDPITNWPGLIDVTPRPTSSTMPQYSWPIGVGAATG